MDNVSKLIDIEVNYYYYSTYQLACFFRISPGGAGIMAPSGGLFLRLNSSAISAIVTHSTPSCWLMYSMILVSKG